MPGSDLPYVKHIGNVAIEIMSAISRGSPVEDPDLAIQCALLHDSIEDTPTTYDEIRKRFGPDVADGVSALSRNPNLPTKSEQMKDSLVRIKSRTREIWMVKMADRITNHQPPPGHWTAEKFVVAALRLSRFMPTSIPPTTSWAEGFWKKSKITPHCLQGCRSA